MEYGTRKVEHNEQEFINTLPTNIQIILRSIIYKKVIKGIWFLEGKPDAFLSEIIPKTKKIFIPEGDCVYRRRDPASEMFFL